MLPDLGYPEYASGRPKDSAWCRNNASHNVVTVDGTAQNNSYTGRLLSFEPEGKARLVDLSSDGIYPNCTTYRRTAWLVDASARSSYVLDLFRVRGGKEHTLSLHGPPGEVTATGLVLKRQEKGTFAGPDVPFEALDKEWRSKAGFSFLYNVERMPNPPTAFTLDYRATDTRNRIAEGREPHLRIHSLTPPQEAALADGDPPQNKRGAPRRMRYLLLTRKGENLESTFVTILEPYDWQPFIQSVRRLEVAEAAPDTHPVAVEVTLADGRRDVLISCETPGRVRVEGGITLEGAHGFLSFRGGQVECAKLMEGTLLERGAFRLTAETAAHTGTLARVLAEDPNDQQLELSAPLPYTKELAGRTIFVENDGEQGAAYTIVSAQGARVSLRPCRWCAAIGIQMTTRRATSTTSCRGRATASPPSPMWTWPPASGSGARQARREGRPRSHDRLRLPRREHPHGGHGGRHGSRAPGSARHAERLVLLVFPGARGGRTHSHLRVHPEQRDRPAVKHRWRQPGGSARARCAARHSATPSPPMPMRCASASNALRAGPPGRVPPPARGNPALAIPLPHRQGPRGGAAPRGLDGQAGTFDSHLPTPLLRDDGKLRPGRILRRSSRIKDGQWLREQVGFLVVPFIDKDGVEDDDQGKNRFRAITTATMAGSLYPPRALRS